jgi:hypothetical protein
MTDDMVLVSRKDVEDVLRVVPSWVPEGAIGDNLWTPESLEAKKRLRKILDAYD